MKQRKMPLTQGFGWILLWASFGSPQPMEALTQQTAGAAIRANTLAEFATYQDSLSTDMKAILNQTLS